MEKAATKAVTAGRSAWRCLVLTLEESSGFALDYLRRACAHQLSVNAILS